jgi:drug/metabolite transporter (DMT)-like permease
MDGNPERAASATRRLAILMVLASAIGFSFNGLIVRLLETATPPQAAFYRSLGMTLGLLAVYSVLYRGFLFRIVAGVGWIGVLGAALMGTSMLTMVTAMYHTTVANVVFMSSAIPFFTAGLAWLLLRERVTRGTLIAMAVAFSGIVIMVGGGISVGAGFGNLIAILSALTYALAVVVVRLRQETNMAPMVALAGVWVCIGVPIATGAELAVSPRDLALCLAWGAVIAGAGHSLFVLAARRLAGAEVTFMMLLEFVLSPIWVWLIVSEVPSESTLVGGALVIGALAGWTLVTARTT